MLSYDAAREILKKVEGKVYISEDEIHNIVVEEAQNCATYYGKPFSSVVRTALVNLLSWIKDHKDYHIRPNDLANLRSNVSSLRRTTLWALMVGHELEQQEKRVDLKEATKRIMDVYFDCVEPVYPIENTGDRRLTLNTVTEEQSVLAEVEDSGGYENMSIQWFDNGLALVFWLEKVTLKYKTRAHAGTYLQIVKNCIEKGVDIKVCFDDDPYKFSLREGLELIEAFLEEE